MRIKLAIFFVFSLSILIVVPAYADVTTLSLGENTYPKDGKFLFIGNEEDGSTSVFVIIRDSIGDFIGMLSDPSSDSDGTYSTLPRDVSQFFKSKGFFNATAFTDNQKEENGITIKIEYDGDKIFVVPDFVLKLNTITDQIVEEKKTVTFTATLTESLADAVFSLEKNPPVGASIDSKTGKFLWTPTESQGPATYVFDIVVKKGAVEDRKTLKITVTEPATPISQSEPKSEPEPEPEEPEIEEPESTEIGLASFVDPTRDPQSYVDRYNNEPSYKKWFDENFPDMTIYDAVGLEESEIKEPESGQCGSGTDLVDGICTIVDNSQGGGCLIATAAYGSEMAPQVQFLREIRDNKVMSTSSGVSFMTGFNQFYYSFSPTIADMERENPMFKELVKIGITPMLTSLSIMSAADTEQEIVGYGIGVILMNIGMYFVAPVMLFFGIKKAKTQLSF